MQSHTPRQILSTLATWFLRTTWMEGLIPILAVVIVMALVPSDKAAAAPRPVASGIVYGGHATDGSPWALTLSPDHKRVASVLLQADVPCADGTGYSLVG